MLMYAAARLTPPGWSGDCAPMTALPGQGPWRLAGLRLNWAGRRHDNVRCSRSHRLPVSAKVISYAAWLPFRFCSAWAWWMGSWPCAASSSAMVEPRGGSTGVSGHWSSPRHSQAKSDASCLRHVAHARGHADDRRREALAAACRWPDCLQAPPSRGAGYPGAEPARHAGRQAPDVQAAAEANSPISRRDQRQAGKRRGSQVPPDACWRTKDARGGKQRGRRTRTSRRDGESGRCSGSSRLGRHSTSSPPMTGSATSFRFADTKFQPSSVEPPGPRPFRFEPKSPVSPPRCSHGHAGPIARHRDLSPTS